MAVQAQYPSNAISPDLFGRAPGSIVLEGLQIPQDRALLDAYVLGEAPPLPANNCGTMFSDPQSEMTCNASASRKRPRDQLPQSMLPLPPSVYPVNPFLSSLPTPGNVTAIQAKLPQANAAPHLQQSRLLGSGFTSTSGRPAVGSILAHDVVACFHRHNVEIDALVRLQTERLRFGLEEARNRHYRVLLQTMEQAAARLLREKEAELESAVRRNAELEEKVRQMSAESEVWFNVAKNNETIASSLRATLEPLLLLNAAAPHGGESAVPNPADDAESCCFEGGDEAAPREERWVCRACREKAVCVLVLPCRHLCICSECEPGLDSCPVCRCAKNACMRVFTA